MRNQTERKAADVPELNEREMFVLRCLNAAVNLYGVLTVDECVRLYNHYAKGEPAPVSDEMTVGELEDVMTRLTDAVDAGWANPDTSRGHYVDLPDVWFVPWIPEKDSEGVIVYYDLASLDDDASPEVSERDVARITRRLEETRASFEKIDLNLLPEEDFFDYEVPGFSEETEESEALVKFLQREFQLTEALADYDVASILSNARVNGASCTEALKYIRDTLGWRPQGQDQFMRLIKALSPALSATRLWRGRGRSTSELCKMGLVEKYEAESIPTDIFDDDEESEASRVIDGWRRDSDDDDYDDEEEGDLILPEDIPLSVYNGPIDFKFVKDPAKREAKLSVYEDVRQAINDFGAVHVKKHLLDGAIAKVCSRFGFHQKNDVFEDVPPDLWLVMTEFALFLDDQVKETPCQCALADSKDFDAIEKRIATYFENFRFTWLEVLAVKAGVGVKCRDLLTGEEIFLMDESFSLYDVKGRVAISHISPMEDVYVSLGNISPLPFGNEKVVLDRILEQLRLPTERPIRLSFDQQRKFAAETIKAYVALRRR
jgi:hypothetical protein